MTYPDLHLEPPMSPERFGQAFTDVAPIPGVEPYRGYELLWDAVPGVNSAPVMYVLRGPLGDAFMPVSGWRLNFYPTQERFNWFVDAGLPQGKVLPNGLTGKFGNHDIDSAIRAERLQVAA